MAVLVSLTGCKKGPEQGTEQGPCYPNKTCNEGLACLSALCVKPSPAQQVSGSNEAAGQGAGAAIAIAAFDKYKRKAMTTEAVEGLARMRVGANSYFQSDHYSNEGNVLPKRFPAGKTGWVPDTPCCKQPGGQCRSDPAIWSKPPWSDLQFSLSDPHRYQWRYSAEGENTSAKVSLEARGDLDCNGKFSSFKVLGRIGSEADVLFEGPIIADELE